MGRNKENISTEKQGYKLTYNQLIKWGLKFDELRFGKPTFDVYVDDKNFYSKNGILNFLKSICDNVLFKNFN